MKYRKLASGFVAAAIAVGVFATPYGEVLPVISESVAVNAGAEVYGDFEYSVSGDTAEITKYKGSASTLVIPSEIGGKKVTGIGRMAFASCTTLTDVTIPDSVTSIGDWAFSDCDAIVNVKIPDTVTYLGEYAFRSCSSLTSVHIPKGIKTIEMRAFLCCSSLESLTIPENITSIGLGAFSLCAKLTDVTIPGNVKTVGEDAFSNCTELLNVTISDGVTSIGKSAFASCYLLKNITIADSVTSIGEDAFYWCSNLTSVKLPKDLDKINSYTFRFCKGLTDISIPYGVTSIDRCAFMGCEALTKVIIPKSVTVIDESAFYGCKVLSDVTMPEGVTTIGEDAFCDCTALLSVKIPKSVTAIGSHAFGYDSSYTKNTGFKVYCYKNSAGEKYAKDNGFDYKTITNKPAKVTGLAFGARSADYVSLKWNKDANADGYIVEYLSGNKFVKLTDKTSGLAVSYKVTGLEAGTLYKFRVRSYVNENGKRVYGEYSDVLNIRTLPKAMSNLKLGARTDNSISLKWDKNETANGAVVEMYKNGKWEVVSTKTSNTTVSHKITGLKAGTQYKFRVRAYINDEGGRIYSVYNVTLNEVTAPAAVTNFRSVISAKTAIRFNWNKNTAVDGYEIDMAVGSSWVKQATIEGSNSVAYAQTKLTPDTAYRFRIRAYKTVDGKKIYSAYTTANASTAK